MQWYYADQGRQVGPVDEAALDSLAASGVIRADTLVWRQGMADWAPHASVREMPPGAMPAEVAAATVHCGECGRPFPLQEVVVIGSVYVCAGCKPIYLQRVREGGR